MRWYSNVVIDCQPGCREVNRDATSHWVGNLGDSRDEHQVEEQLQPGNLPSGRGRDGVKPDECRVGHAGFDAAGGKSVQFEPTAFRARRRPCHKPQEMRLQAW